MFLQMGLVGMAKDEERRILLQLEGDKDVEIEDED